MKAVLPVLFFFCSIPSFCQNITESIFAVNEGYSSGKLLLNYFRNYDVGSTDTTYNVLVKLTSKETQVEGFSLGTAMFGSLGIVGSGVSVSLKTNVSSDQVVLSLDQFSKFYDCINKVFVYLIDKGRFESEGYNTVATCNVEGLIVGGELRPKSSTKEYVFYLKSGDDSYYRASLEEYKSTLQKIAKIKADINSRLGN